MVRERVLGLEDLPLDVVQLILLQLRDGKDWIRTSLTCRRLRRCVQKELRMLPRPRRVVLVNWTTLMEHVVCAHATPAALAGFGVRKVFSGEAWLSRVLDIFDNRELYWGNELGLRPLSLLPLLCLARSDNFFFFRGNGIERHAANLWKPAADLVAKYGGTPSVKVHLSAPYGRRWEELRELFVRLAACFPATGVLLYLVGGCVEPFSRMVHAGPLSERGDGEGVRCMFLEHHGYKIEMFFCVDRPEE